MKEADIYGTLHRRPVPGQEAIRRVRLSEAETMYDNRTGAEIACNFDGLSSPSDDFHGIRECQLLGYL